MIANRGSSSDVYAHCHSIPDPNYASFDTTETKIVEILTKGKTLSTADAETLTGFEVLKVVSGDTDQIMPVCYPADTIEQDAVLASVYKNNTVIFDSHSTKLSKPSSDNNQVTLSVDNTSTSIYDTVVKVQTSIEANLTSTDNTVDAVFDTNDSNAAVQYAVNSQYNTKTNIVDMANADVYPTYVQEDTDYNTNKAFGKNYTQYISGIDASSGQPIWSNYSNAVASITDKFDLTLREASSLSEEVDFDPVKDFGIFKVAIALDEEPFKTTLKTGSSLNEADLSEVTLAPVSVNNPVAADTHIRNLPLFHETASLSLSNQTKTANTSSDSDNSKFLLPSSNITLDNFMTLIDASFQNEIQPNFSFTVAINANSESGYKFADSSYDLVSIDDSNLKDSLVYMRDWVDKPHSLDLTNQTLSLTTGTNGVSDVISNNEIVLAGNREKLSQTEAGVDGVILLNSHAVQTRADITASSVDSSNMKVNVYYENDDISSSGLTRLSDDLCVEPIVSFGWQKVIESSSESTVKFKDNSNTTLNLVSNGVNINSLHIDGASKINYTFDHTQLPTNNDVVQLWKISSGVKLVSEPSVFLDPSNTDVDGIISSVVLRDATKEFNETNRELRQLVTLKSLNELQINNNFVSNGWTSFTSNNLPFLESKSSSAFVSLRAFPAYDPYFIPHFISSANNNTLEYIINYKTETIGNNNGELFDSCDISYTYDSDEFDITHANTLFTIKLNDTNITQTSPPTSTEVTLTYVSDYSFKSGSGLSPVQYYVTRTTVVTRYTSTFEFPLAQYTNISVTTPEIVSTTVFYNIRSKSTGAIQNRNFLKNVVSQTTPIDFFKYTQSIAPYDPSDNLMITGNLSKNDLKELFVETQAINIDTNEWQTISDKVDGSIFYNLVEEPIINDVSDNLLTGSSNVETSLSFFDFDEFGNNLLLTLDKPTYVIPLVMDYTASEYKLKIFTTTSDRTELENKTSLTSLQSDSGSQLANKVLDVNNLYNVVNSSSWVTPSNYKIVTSINNNDITLKIVNTSDPNETAIITININDNYIFVGDFIVSNIKKDVIRIRELVGSTYTEQFIERVPGISSFTLKDGVYVNKVNTSEVIPLGAYQLFNLKKDLLSYNIVGSSLAQAQEISTLGPYQWTNDQLYSDSFSLTKYRGHGHPSYSATSVLNNVDQYYNIVRPDIDATFTITDGSSTLSQTFNNIYSGAVLSLNNLKRNPSDAYPSDIGLELTFHYSMPSAAESKNKPINVVGDDVTITIVNPNSSVSSYANLSPANSLDPDLYPLNKTLKDYNLFRFSGENAYKYYDGPFKLASSRVKLQSGYNLNAFSENSMVYSITWDYQPENVIVKATRAKVTGTLPNNLLNFVGNPESVGFVQNTTWAQVDAETHELTLVEARTVGLNIGAYNMKLKEGVDIVNTVYYYVSSYPYYKYETMGVGNNITIPYNYTAGDFSGNRVVKYMPNMSMIKDVNGDITPFTNITYSDMLKNTHDVTMDNTNNLVNNMKMQIRSPYVRKQKDLLYNSNSTKLFIQFFGSKMVLDLYKGSQLIKNVYNGYISSLTQDLSNNIAVVPSSVNSGIKFMVRQPLSIIGLSETDADHAEFYNTNDKSKWFPFKFTLTNVNMVRSEMVFNMLAGPGSYPILYTVKEMLSFSNPEILSRRVYKYEHDTAVDFDSNSLKSSLTFSSRKYVDIQVPSLVTGQDFNSNRYSDLLESINVGSLVWQNDTEFADNGVASFSLIYGNQSVADKFRRECFYANNNETVFTLIHYKPLMVMNNQIGMPLYSVQWNGYLKVPQVSSETYCIAPQRDSYLVSESSLTTDLVKHSILKLNK